MALRKAESHGRIGEAAVAAKCWMHGVPAYNTAGLRPNFAGSDLIVDTAEPRRKLLVQVKTGYCQPKDVVYLTQCAGEVDLTHKKFVADFVIFVNLDYKAGSTHQHDGTLDFQHLRYYVVPRDAANEIYREAVRREHERPLKTGGQRKLGNLTVYVSSARRGAWLALLDSPVRARAAALVAAHEPAMRHAQVRRQLIGFTVDAAVLRAVIARGSARDYRDVFHRVVDLEREHCDGRWAPVLASGMARQLRELTRDDIVDACASAGPAALPYLIAILAYWSPGCRRDRRTV